MLIHYIINNRTKNRFQFAPVMPVLNIQKIGIEHQFLGDPKVSIDNRLLNADEKEILAKNDGFNNADDLFAWFNRDYSCRTTKIIHWTNLKY